MIKAVAEQNFERMMVRVQVGETDHEGRIARTFSWPTITVETITDGAVAAEPDTGLWLAEDQARAVYEALADYFGHSGHDTRALRRDYDAERGRVDKLINHMIGRRA